MFGTSGIRGPVGDMVTGSLALDLGRALGSMSERLVVGRDARESGEALAGAAIAGAQEAGADVVDLGVESTPTIARSVAWYDADAGLDVTASHNPPTDNGFKVWTATGEAFDDAATSTLETRMADAASQTVSPAAMGTVTHAQDARRRHLKRLPDRDLDGLSVVVDVGNGTGGLTVDALLAQGCDVRTLDAQRDGSFPGRPSEPTPEHCALLSTVVAHTDADLGIAHDGDADRMMAVDETGQFVSGDELLAVFATETVPPGASVAAPINTSSLLESVLSETGGTVVRTAVGDGNVAAACREPSVAFGGEPSGAWIWPAEARCPDGHYAASRLAALVASGRPLSERVDAFPNYVTRRESFACERNDALLDAAESRIRDRYDEVSTLDGVRVDFETGWFLLRASGTEPLVRVTAEADTERRADELLDEAMGCVRTTATQPQD
ncbi:MAG: phosphoglucosamine mutase [Halorhabdus sp.]